ncbi:MAG: family 78 glycoside hydrolase catalytic domain, partial [Propionicimonas sp.]|nr:family 78 glycoside hydrolase catalytic domain [Propionicimonas sp.]
MRHPRTLVAGTALTLALGLASAPAPALASPSSPPTAPAGDAGIPTVAGLRTNSLVDPIGIDGAAPRLGWQLSATGRGSTQTAYQIRVASTDARLDSPDVWDSGKVASPESVEVAYGGPALTSQTSYAWQVRVWDQADRASSWSATASFETGLLDPSEWQASWIGAPATSIGESWRNYTIDFTASKIGGALGVYFRGRDTEHAYMWQLSQSENSLRPHVKNPGYSVLTATPFPAGFSWSAEHRYRIEVSGTTIRTFVDGVLLDSRTNATHTTPGVMGFRTSGAETGLVHDLKVTSADGRVLVDTTFPAGDRTFRAGTIVDGSLRVDSAGAEVWYRTDDPAPLLRTSFDLGGKQVARARVYASARGVYRLFLNGERVGDAELAPGWTDYRTRIDYQTYDVTDLLRGGGNALGAEVARGWYAGNIAMFGANTYGSQTSVIAQLRVEFADGTSTTVVTDGSWRTTDGPVRSADLLDGEEYDGRRAAELAGWSDPAFDASAWTAVQVRGTESKTVLEPQTSVPVRVTQELATARRIDTPTAGTFLYDLGQNFVGHIRLTVRGSRGDIVKLRHGEVLNPDGSLYTANLRTAKATDYYTLSSDQPETWAPSYTFHGFRYLEISGLAEAPDAAAITGVVVGTDGDLVSSLETNSDLVDQLHRNIVWG